jgi:hypothetical protein
MLLASSAVIQRLASDLYGGANGQPQRQKTLRIKPLLIDLLLQHQRVKPTFLHLLPIEDGSPAGAITKGNEIPNSEEKIKNYVKAMHDVDSRNNSTTYTVVFYIKIASTMTLLENKRKFKDTNYD